MRTPLTLNIWNHCRKFAAQVLVLLVSTTVWAEGGPLTFKDRCVPGEKLTLAAVGDVLLHAPLQVQGFEEKDSFKSLWQKTIPLLKAANLTYANLEGPAAGPIALREKSAKDPGLNFDNKCYTGYPRFNYHPIVLADLLESGIDVVSTANNHSMDRGSKGVDHTIDHLRAAGLPYAGTRKTGDTLSPWHVITKSSGFKIAWVACTYDTNGIPDKKNQVLLCYEDRTALLKVVTDLSSFPGIDAVIVTPHWGAEYENNESAEQRELGRELLDAGATAVIGSHPHVLQPWEKYKTHDGREGFIIYSLGNFVSGQRSLEKRTSVVLYLGLTRDSNHRTFVNGVRFVPLAMEEQGGQLTSVPLRKKGRFSESYKHAVSQLNEAQVLTPGEPLVTNPGCP